MSRERRDPAHAVWRALTRLVRERFARRPGAHLIEASLESLELRLSLALRDAGGAADRFSETLVGEIDRLLDDAIHQAAAFRPGRAYCHRCARVDCEHAQPPGCRHVFIGYAPTGTPRWEDFAQCCLDQRHPSVDLLYEQPPALVTLVRSGSQLHAGMLEAFQDRDYELLGQLAAGFFPVPARPEEGRVVVALTVQVAASYRRGGPARLGLNVLGRAPSGEELERLWDRQGELPWHRSVRWAQAALQTLVKPGRGRRSSRDREASRADLQRRTEGILHGLARRLERDQRARSRRTRHAADRHASGSRPTRKALDDAREVPAGELLLDERSGALVVLGDRGRTHFFTPDGRHVSSVRYSRDAIARKLKTEVWRPAPTELGEAFRAKLPSS